MGICQQVRAMCWAQEAAQAEDPISQIVAFLHTHNSAEVAAGPGPGAHSGKGNWNAASTRFGGPPGSRGFPYQDQSAPYTGTGYLKPDYLSKDPKGPAWSFGLRHKTHPQAGPGVGAYSPGTSTMGGFRQLHSSWGPPPRPRPPSAPPMRPSNDKDRSKPKPNSALPGATFKGTWPKLPASDSPGPAAYMPCCQGNHCCDMCEKYNGWSFGTRHHRYVPPPHPGPNDYHVGCTTLGAAAAGCSDAKDPNHSYHKPTRRDHNYYQ